MLCEYCNKKEATIHLTEILEGERSEAHLCEFCAKKIGINSKLSGFSPNITDMLSFIEVDEAFDDTNRPSAVCGVCGTDFSKYANSGKVGCPDCYAYLKENLSGVINGYHGDKIHAGKIPAQWRAPAQKKRSEAESDLESQSVVQMEKYLKQAVLDERYEEAALLRDKIKQAVQSRG